MVRWMKTRPSSRCSSQTERPLWQHASANSRRIGSLRLSSKHMSAMATINLAEVASQWRSARRLYPIYAAIAREFDLGAPCRELESPINRSEPEVLQAA